EFQDTDPIQAEIALYLAEGVPPGTPDAARPKRWREIKPEPGKLFVVGDPKQSIYRFRHADITLVDQLRSLIGMDSLALVQNFRSHRPVIEWVNHLFGQWMQRTDGQPEYLNLEWRWDGDGGGQTVSPGVYRLGAALPLPAPQVRRREAREIANLVRQIRDEAWPVTEHMHDDGSGVFRPARYSDICLLLPRRTGLLHNLEPALEDAGVPYRVESASLVFETQEVRDLLNCLEAVDNPVDQVALAAALRSPAFACSDADLLTFVDGGGRLDYLSPSDRSPEGPVLDALRALQAYHADCRWTPFPLLTERFIRERRLMELALSHPRPREQWRRYQFVVDRARAFAEAGGDSLRAFLRWMREQESEQARSVETPVPEGDEDAIRILTIHGAKGLEFPIVILADLGARPDYRPPAVLFDREADAIEVRLGRSETVRYDALRQAEAEREAEQQVRLMYVAATRAKDHLIVSCYRTEGNYVPVAGRIDGFLGNADHLWQPLAAKEAPLLPAPRSGIQGADADTPEARADWAAERQRLLRVQSRPEAIAATGLAKEEREDIALEAEPWRRGRAGTSIGRAVHAVLQSVDLATGEGLKETARAQAQAESVPERAAEVEGLARRAIDSAAVRRAVASSRWWREVPVGVPVGGGVLEGFIDLLFEEDDGLVVVDYKTDALPDEKALREAMRRYRLQGGAYALAVGRVTGKPVKEVIFVFLQPQTEERVDELPSAMAEAEAEAARLLTAT
ncbi:MAG: 3'-5' exonuclease, partial [Dehalococcoidia bacterium]